MPGPRLGYALYPADMPSSSSCRSLPAQRFGRARLLPLPTTPSPEPVVRTAVPTPCNASVKTPQRQMAATLPKFHSAEIQRANCTAIERSRAAYLTACLRRDVHLRLLRLPRSAPYARSRSRSRGRPRDRLRIQLQRRAAALHLPAASCASVTPHSTTSRSVPSSLQRASHSV